MTHTPRPWEAASKPSSVVGWPVVGELGTLIADVSTMSFPGQPIPKEALANARLIAAAPELLEALDWAIAEIEGRTRYAPNDVYEAEEQRANALACARAAIAKAKGE
jgi:hypothetical protein